MQKPHLDNSNPQSPSTPSWIWLALSPSLLTLWSCLSVLQQRTSDIPPVGTLLTTLAVALATVLVLQVILAIVTRSSVLASLLTLLLVSFIGLHGPVSAIFTVGHRTLDKPLFFCVWSIIHLISIVGLFVLMRRKVLLNQFATAMTVALIFIVGVQATKVTYPLLADLSRIDTLDKNAKTGSPLNPQESLASGDQSTPDIYYLIVDAYARQDVLSEVYGHDNSSFIESLRSRGFYVGGESRSNYNFTEYSLASSLNMRHLEEFDLKPFLTRMPLRHLVRNSTVTTSLKNTGYRTYAIETGKSETECDNFDHYVKFGKALNDYQDVLYHGTPLPQILKWTGLVRSAARRHGDRVIFALDQVPELASTSSDPAFVFCHLLAPHPPFLFDAQGNEVEFRGHYLLSDCRNFTSCYNYDLDIYRARYREQLVHMNSRLIEMIDRIQASERESVIILQADHGPRLGFGFQREGAATCPWRFRESFSILNAIAMPAERTAAFYPSMTPVNTFRIVFNELFATQLEQQPDESYAVADYELVPVTQSALPLKLTTVGTNSKKKLGVNEL